MSTFYIFEPLKAHTYEANISLIRLILIKQNPELQNKICFDRDEPHKISVPVNKMLHF